MHIIYEMPRWRWIPIKQGGYYIYTHMYIYAHIRCCDYCFKFQVDWFPFIWRFMSLFLLMFTLSAFRLQVHVFSRACFLWLPCRTPCSCSCVKLLCMHPSNTLVSWWHDLLRISSLLEMKHCCTNLLSLSVNYWEQIDGKQFAQLEPGFAEDELLAAFIFHKSQSIANLIPFWGVYLNCFFENLYFFMTPWNNSR